MRSEAIKYYLTYQNVRVTLDEFGNKILVTEDTCIISKSKNGLLHFKYWLFQWKKSDAFGYIN